MIVTSIIALVAFIAGWYANDKFLTWRGLWTATKSAASRFWAYVKSFKGSAS